ncbi:FecCD family ABC transporter permease [Limibacillus halophilus]|uniref:Iron complex transport system permease protein n=1 Tax=Limibacillus halophilus TaxID=1579333 RepID=A0A839SWJ2_9PROT|nr:iron ABC transporter permease [Limibacillus halophilus]MBB3066044.1 iron complex transport system permease protein [Limibacillus halophilus]
MAEGSTSSSGILYLVLLLLVFLAAVASLAIGPADIGPLDLWRGLLGGDERVVIILGELRLPRTLLALLVGGSLGLAGAALQGYLRNPLAEPGIIGVSAAASLGAVLAFYFGLAGQLAALLPVAGILGAGAAVLLVQLLAGRQAGSVTLILAGVAVSAFASALTSLALNLAPSPFAALEIVFWLLGSLADRSFPQLWLVLPFILVGWLLLLSTGRSLDALTLGEDAAASLGVDVARLRWRLVGGTALAVGAATAVAGAIGFVGLVVPHLLRPFVGQRPSRLLPASLLGGGLLLLAADLVVRLFSNGQELKLGVVTALIGAPFFLWLVLRQRRAL